MGHSVLLEHHYQFGGLATWFKQAGGHIFDISLHGFPVGMIKSCRRYWTKEIADSIVQLKGIRFVNPQYELSTTFDRMDFTRILQDTFKGCQGEDRTVLRPPQEDGLLRERQKDYCGSLRRVLSFPAEMTSSVSCSNPLRYANGSSLMDPAFAYGIVFTNFMRRGIYTFKDGTDSDPENGFELRRNGAVLKRQCLVQKLITEEKTVVITYRSNRQWKAHQLRRRLVKREPQEHHRKTSGKL